MTIVIFDAFGGGGVARTVINLANYLVEHRDVELISVFRRRLKPRFPVDPRVRVVVLHDRRRSSSRRQRTLIRVRGRLLRSRLALRRRGPQVPLLSDPLLHERLRKVRGILLTTRPSLHLAATTYARREVIKVGQDHLNAQRRLRRPRQVAIMRAVLPRLDAMAVLTAGDASDYGALPESRSTEIVHLPNALPWPVSEESAPLTAKVVVSAGRISWQKGFDRMVRAWALVAEHDPDWQLHIYGNGLERRRVRRLIRRLGLQGQVQLKGYTRNMASALASASVFAMTSRYEGFGMVLIEAMSQGVPPVAMDCPRGPSEIIQDGHNGRLVPNGDIPAFAAALRELIEDRELRVGLGRQAHEDARAYERDAIGARWETLFDELVERRSH